MAVSHKDIHAPRLKGHIDSNNVDFVSKDGIIVRKETHAGDFE